MSTYPDILDLIPQRPPFLFVDKIIDRSDQKITTTLKLTGNEDFFKGHFPGNPIMPGVLLQEALFQSGAALMAGRAGGGLGVVTRVQNAKFKNMVRPGDELVMDVELTESISNAHYMKGTTKVDGKTVLVIEFAVASV
ncbi:beta-hydroxyacyl-ACP dehydratase [Bacteriovorax stolpii]|uniref:Beta-hydroxyacyl-ACP dehydratase n=1 Tax=Bacteriovorax stolpii TaxID=960 RepID=A0A2K9NSQ9_BACTC|nr:3-hydroxyacyl-ACP dehydratase FabZ [Bacteriovorax stolpii]AUN98125.1 beta-hydroxyacyl-ACP dehydratase [Bacteriovorax stolpii]QDK41895.1 beta-hydroxyacyl-ACP dehydratase [Bacteriovorax stolpii]TDP52038.1 3-hydroxyacyl-[acyl-carrier-protein] dehydratase [Bacteriovorax stolpii]